MERKQEKQEEKNLLASYYGGKAFVKIKQCLEIGKIQFSFVEKDNSKNYIDCYMEAEEFGAILMPGIKTGSLIKALMTEKAKGEQYPKAVWTSPIGGNATGNNGKPISRYFEISPGSSSEVLFTAMTFPAEKNATGAFIKVKGSKAISTLRIPCSYNDLKILAYKWSFLENDYMSKKYCLENMKSEYQPKCDDTYAAPTAYEEAGNPTQNEAPKTIQPQNDDEEVPFVGSSSSDTTDKASAVEAKVSTIKLVATSKLEKIPNKNIKVCHVTDEEGIEKRLICLMDKIADTKKFESFETQLTSRVSANKTLEFKAEIAVKGNDYYLKKFA